MWIRRSQLDEVHKQAAALAEAVARGAAAAEAARDEAANLREELVRQREILQLLHDREPEMRDRLQRVRAAPDYELAFSDPEPLVSIIIPTYDRGDLLASVAIPSVLAQTYQRFEIVVVGDAAPEQTQTLLAAFDDPRITYRNMNRRGPYPDGGRALWHVAGVPPRNEAARLARGRWIAPLDDDDAFAPEHIERLLALAQSERHEVAYGLLRCVMNDGNQFNIGVFPPVFGQFGWQGAIFHAGLRIFEMELADALFGSPGDWSLCRRLLRAGARFGMLDEVVTDHFESRLTSADDDQTGNRPST